MKKLIYATIAVLLMVMAAAGARAENATAPLKIVNDITYVTRGEMQIKGNIYRPEGSAVLPGLVLAHGGGFVAGDKDHYNIPEISRYLAGRGYVVFAVNYRYLQQGGLFPANAQDVKCAIQWLRAHADEYGVDTSKIAVMGNSAGGYMASFAAVTQHNEQFNASCGDPALDAQKPEVALAVLWYGVHDFTTMKGSLVSTLETAYFPKVKEADKLKYKKLISPITYADQAPPVFMIHGQEDPLVPIQQSREMCAAIKKAGGDCTLEEFPKMGHGFIDEKFAQEGSVKALKMTGDWLDNHFAAMTAECHGKKE